MPAVTSSTNLARSSSYIAPTYYPDPESALRQDIVDELGHLRRRLLALTAATRAAARGTRPRGAVSGWQRKSDQVYNDPRRHVRENPDGSIEVSYDYPRR